MRTPFVLLFVTLPVLSACGFREDDPVLDEAHAWVREFRMENREAAKEIDKICVEELTQSPWTRDGSLELFQCIRAKAEARGYT